MVDMEESSVVWSRLCNYINVEYDDGVQFMMFLFLQHLCKTTGGIKFGNWIPFSFQLDAHIINILFVLPFSFVLFDHFVD